MAAEHEGNWQAAFESRKSRGPLARRKVARLCRTLLMRNPLAAALGRDPLLAGLTLLLAVLVLLPIFQTPVLPLTDWANHVAMAEQVPRILRGDSVVSHHYALQPHPAPYWLVYILLLLVSSVSSTLFAAKAVVALAILALPLGTMRLLIALGRSPRIGLWSFALCWDLSLTMGFIAFSLTMGLALVFVGRAFEVSRLRGGRLVRGVALTSGLGFVLAAGHAHAAGTAAALVGALALAEWPNRKRAFRLLALSFVPVLWLVPWLALGADSGPANPDLPDRVGDWPNLSFRLSHLVEYTTDVTGFPFGRNVAGLAFLVLLLGPWLLRGFGETNHRAFRRAVFLYGMAWLLYFAMPMNLYKPFYQAFIYERHATLLLLMGLALVPRSIFRERAWALWPGVGAAGAMALALLIHTHQFARHVRPLFEIIDAVEPGSRVNWVMYEATTPTSRWETLRKIMAYTIAEKGGYSPHLFDSPNLPVVFRRDRHLPHVPWYRGQDFTMARHARGYDYVIVQGRSDHFLRLDQGEVHAVPRLQAGLWTLYAIEPAAQGSSQ